MTDENIPQVANAGFEGLKKTNQYDKEYWSARDLQPLLGYTQWRRFENAVKKAITSCEQSGNDPEHHFARAKWSTSARTRPETWMITSFPVLPAI